MIITSSLNSLPNLSDVINSWASDYTAYLIKKKIKNYILVEKKRKTHFKGMVQNFNKKELQIKPIGERNWGKYELHSTRKFKNDDIIEINKIRYRIMSTRNNDTYYGFWAYNLLETYKEEKQ